MIGLDVAEFLEEYVRDMENIEREIIELVIFMDGGVTYEEAWETTTSTRELMVKVQSDIMKKKAGK